MIKPLIASYIFINIKKPRFFLKLNIVGMYFKYNIIIYYINILHKYIVKKLMQSMKSSGIPQVSRYV